MTDLEALRGILDRVGMVYQDLENEIVLARDLGDQVGSQVEISLHFSSGVLEAIYVDPK